MKNGFLNIFHPNIISHTEQQTIFTLSPINKLFRSTGLFYVAGSLIGLVQMIIFKNNRGNSALYWSNIFGVIGIVYFGISNIFDKIIHKK